MINTLIPHFLIKGNRTVLNIGVFLFQSDSEFAAQMDHGPSKNGQLLTGMFGIGRWDQVALRGLRWIA